MKSSHDLSSALAHRHRSADLLDLDAHPAEAATNVTDLCLWLDAQDPGAVLLTWRSLAFDEQDGDCAQDYLRSVAQKQTTENDAERAAAVTTKEHQLALHDLDLLFSGRLMDDESVVAGRIESKLILDPAAFVTRASIHLDDVPEAVWERILAHVEAMLALNSAREKEAQGWEGDCEPASLPAQGFAKGKSSDVADAPVDTSGRRMLSRAKSNSSIERKPQVGETSIAEETKCLNEGTAATLRHEAKMVAAGLTNLSALAGQSAAIVSRGDHTLPNSDAGLRRLKSSVGWFDFGDQGSDIAWQALSFAPGFGPRQDGRPMLQAQSLNRRAIAEKKSDGKRQVCNEHRFDGGGRYGVRTPSVQRFIKAKRLGPVAR